MTKPRGTTLIMGAAVGYGESQIAPFLASLRRTGYAGAIALIVDPALARDGAKSPMLRDVRLLTARQWPPVRWGFFRPGRRLLRDWVWLPLHAILWGLVTALRRAPVPGRWRESLQVRLALAAMPPTETRYFVYRDFLRRNRFERIMLTDVRDVLFQSDPFAHVPERGLALSFEVPRHTVGGERHNAFWVRLAFGDRQLRAIASNPVSCSGVTFGDHDSMAAYLDAMCGELLGLDRRAAGQSGVDQGVHNYLLWTDRLGDVHRLEPLRSAVATVGGVAELDAHLDEAGRLLNQDGTVPAVIHQYNRWPTAGARLTRALAQ